MQLSFGSERECRRFFAHDVADSGVNTPADERANCTDGAKRP